jgi:hypothetical protein
MAAICSSRIYVDTCSILGFHLDFLYQVLCCFILQVLREGICKEAAIYSSKTQSGSESLDDIGRYTNNISVLLRTAGAAWGHVR